VWANGSDRGRDDVGCDVGSCDGAMLVLPMVVLPCRKNKGKGQVFFEWANRIDRNLGDVGYCGDVSILGSVLTSASKGNWHMVASSSGSAKLAPL